MYSFSTDIILVFIMAQLVGVIWILDDIRKSLIVKPARKETKLEIEETI